MFKRGFPSDGMIGGGQQPAASIQVPQPGSFDARFNTRPPFSAFTPDLVQQFPYTFSSAAPPMYSWANTNSTDVMKFTGSSNMGTGLDTTVYRPSNFGLVPKRKIELDAELPQPPKMRITEEKVSASLQNMHISSEFIPHNYCPGPENNTSEMDVLEIPSTTSTNMISTIECTKPESQTTLIMCEELRKLNKIDSIIPQPLLNVERPTKAVVVWKPQPVMDLVRSFTNYEEPKSSVVITEITDDEDNPLSNQDKMFIEDNCNAVEDVEMDL